MNYLVVKIGGRPAAQQDILDALISELGVLGASGFHPILVHGGGADVTELSRKLGVEPTFVAGKRLTSSEEMGIVDAVLAGQVNTRILRRALALKINAVGLSGVDAGLFIGESVDSANNSRTGRITRVDTKILATLCTAGLLPVVSSVSTTPDGVGLNINADDAAMELGRSLKAHALVYLSDIPGILKSENVLRRLNPIEAEAEISSGVIGGGMIPKVRGAIDALRSGIGRVIIGGYEQSGDLKAFLDAEKGTSITL